MVSLLASLTLNSQSTVHSQTLCHSYTRHSLGVHPYTSSVGNFQLPSTLPPTHSTASHTHNSISFTLNLHRYTHHSSHLTAYTRLSHKKKYKYYLYTRHSLPSLPSIIYQDKKQQTTSPSHHTPDTQLSSLRLNFTSQHTPASHSHRTASYSAHPTLTIHST